MLMPNSFPARKEAQMKVRKPAPKIAILGWGSLIWDERPEFDSHHEEWTSGGPVLQLEFSRISESRKGALTLVIDMGRHAKLITPSARARIRTTP